MITIRSSADCSTPALVALEATLTTPIGTYTICSNELMDGSHSPASGTLFGAISWPHSRFELSPGVMFEQQMFLPHDGSAAAFSWQLHSPFPMQADLAIRPLFSGCSPRSYRDVGFQLQPKAEGGRLLWLPNVRGPRIIADTNGSYCDDPPRSRDALDSSRKSEHLTIPGTFEFQVGERPSVLIFSNPDVQAKSSQQIGAFLAGLMPQTNRSALIGCKIHEGRSLVRAA